MDLCLACHCYWKQSRESTSAISLNTFLIQLLFFFLVSSIVLNWIKFNSIQLNCEVENLTHIRTTLTLPVWNLSMRLRDVLLQKKKLYSMAYISDLKIIYDFNILKKSYGFDIFNWPNQPSRFSILIHGFSKIKWHINWFFFQKAENIWWRRRDCFVRNDRNATGGSNEWYRL